MTPKRASTKDEQKAERPRLNKETLKDLDPKRRGEEVKGGATNNDTSRCMVGAGSQNGS